MNYRYSLGSSRDEQNQCQKIQCTHQLLLLYTSSLRMIVAESLNRFTVSSVGKYGPPTALKKHIALKKRNAGNCKEKGGFPFNLPGSDKRLNMS